MALELDARHGYSYCGDQFCMADEHTMVSICGNSLKFASVVTDSHHFLLRNESAPINVLDTCVKTSEVAYSTVDHDPIIHILSYPEKKSRVKLRGGTSLAYAHISFSRCGSRLLSVGKDINRKISVWSMQSYKVLEGCSAECQFPSNFASFNPFDPSEFVIGGNGGIIFWKMCEGYDSYYLTKEEGMSFVDEMNSGVSNDASKNNSEEHLDIYVDDLEDEGAHRHLISDEEKEEKRQTYVCHCWSTNGHVYASNEVGEVLRFEAKSGKIVEVVNLSLEPLEINTSLVLSTEYLIAASSMGTIRWLSLSDFSILNTIQVAQDLPIHLREITVIRPTPSYTKLIVSMKSGTVFEVKLNVEDADKSEEAIVSVVHNYHQGPVTCSSTLTPCGGGVTDTVIATANLVGEIYLWNVATFKLSLTFRLEKLPAVQSISQKEKDNNDEGDSIEPHNSHPMIKESPNVSALASRQLEPIIAIGDEKGYLHIHCVKKGVSGLEAIPITSFRLFHTPLDMLVFDSSEYLAMAASSFDNHVFIIRMDPEKDYKVIAYGIPSPSSPILQSSIQTVTFNRLGTNIVVTMFDSKVYEAALDFSSPESGICHLEFNEIGVLASPVDQAIELSSIWNSLVVSSSASKALRLITLDDKRSFKEMELVGDSHFKNVLSITKSPVHVQDLEIVATGGNDGAICVWLVSSDKQIQLVKRIMAHQGGVSSLEFLHSPNYSQLYSCGTDGVVMSWGIYFDGCTADLGASATFDISLYKDLISLAYCAQSASNENDNLLLVSTMDADPSKTTAHKSDGEDDDAMTVIEEVEFRKISEEMIEHDKFKDRIRLPLEQLKTRLRDLISRNSSFPPIEQLSRDEFVLNVSGKEKSMRENDSKAQKVREKIRREIKELQVITERIQKEFWEDMEVKGAQLHGFSHHNKIVVYNFPLRRRMKSELAAVQKVMCVREVELRSFMMETSGRPVFEDIQGSVPELIGWILNEGVLHPSMSANVASELMFGGGVSSSSSVTNTVSGTGAGSGGNTSSSTSRSGANAAVLEGESKTNNSSMGHEDQDQDQDGYRDSEDQAMREDSLGGNSAAVSSESRTQSALYDSEKDPATCSFSLSDLLYSPFSIRTSKQRRNQILLLQEYERVVQQDFNRSFDQSVRLKETKIDEIEAKNQRIQEIIDELQIEEEYLIPQWHVSEIPSSLIEVKPCEISVSEYETEEKRLEREKAEKEKLRRERERNKDDSAERALDDMMYGTLDGKKDVMVHQTIERESWMDEIRIEDMTDEQRALVEEFELKKKLFEEEREKYRKSLEIELKKLKMEVADFCKSFDEHLKKLQEKYYQVKFFVLVQQLYSMRLAQRCVTKDFVLQQLELAETTLHKLERDYEASQGTIEGFKHKIEKVKEEIRHLIEEDRACEKSFGREMEDASGAGMDQDTLHSLLTLFKQRKHVNGATGAANARALAEKGAAGAKYDPARRRRSFSRRGSEISQNSSKKGTNTTNNSNSSETVSNNPYQSAENSMRGKDKLTQVVELDLETDCPEGLNVSDAVWQRLNEMRAKKISIESKLKAKNEESIKDRDLLEELEFKLGALMGQIGDMRDHIEALTEEFGLVEDNTDLIALLKQGQEEAQANTSPPGAVIDDSEDSILISRNVVESLNHTIKLHGKDQVTILEKIKNFRKNIKLMQWEHRYLELKAKHLEEHYTDLQLLRVTRSLQDFFKGGDTSKQEKHELASTEAKLGHLTKSQATAVNKMNKVVSQLRSQLSSKVRENEKFHKQLQQVSKRVQVREEIRASRQIETSVSHQNQADGNACSIASSAAKKAQKKNARMKAITVRRKLVDLAKGQTAEIEYLRQELDRLRRRTFPSFVQTSHNELRHPDEI